MLLALDAPMAAWSRRHRGRVCPMQLATRACVPRAEGTTAGRQARTRPRPGSRRGGWVGGWMRAAASILAKGVLSKGRGIHSMPGSLGRCESRRSSSSVCLSTSPAESAALLADRSAW